MRGQTVLAIASAMILAACSLGVMDLVLEPTPARLFVGSELEPDPDDPSGVRVTVRSSLQPGVDEDRAVRRVSNPVLRVEGTGYEPLSGDDPSELSWNAVESFSAPGPEGVRLDLPQVDGLGLARSITMRVRVDVSPGDTIRLAEGEDLVLSTEPPSNPAQSVGWRLLLTSAGAPSFQLEITGGDPWPAVIRVPAADIPPEALPLDASLRIVWDRSLDLVRLTPTDRYVLDLQSTMTVEWTVATGT